MLIMIFPESSAWLRHHPGTGHAMQAMYLASSHACGLFPTLIKTQEVKIALFIELHSLFVDTHVALRMFPLQF